MKIQNKPGVHSQTTLKPGGTPLNDENGIKTGRKRRIKQWDEGLGNFQHREDVQNQQLQSEQKKQQKEQIDFSRDEHFENEQFSVEPVKWTHQLSPQNDHSGQPNKVGCDQYPDGSVDSSEMQNQDRNTSEEYELQDIGEMNQGLQDIGEMNQELQDIGEMNDEEGQVSIDYNAENQQNDKSETNRQPFDSTKQSPPNNNNNYNQNTNQNLKVQNSHHPLQLSINEYTLADYSKNNVLTYSAVLKEDIRRKNPKSPLIDPRSPPKQKIQSSSSLQNSNNSISLGTCINNLFSDEFFRGRLSITWLFIIGKMKPELLTKLQEIYRPLTNRDYQMPLCRNTDEALQFFKAQNSIFKVVVDLDNAPQLIQRHQLQSKIFSIYLYNNDAQNGLFRSITLKASSKKVRGFYADLNPLLKRASEDTQNGNKFVKETQGSIEEIKFQSRLPTFIKLSHEDKTEITTYRLNLYGAIKLTDKKERKQKTADFTELVRRVYLNDLDEMKNLQDYLNSIDHQSCLIDDEKKHFRVLRFYVQETFYYKLTNNMLRVCRTVDQFKPLTIPFNQNYNAIKFFYDRSLQQNRKSGKELAYYQLYRGATIKQMDFYQLKEGEFIELLGFISTSKNELYTKNNFIKKSDDFLFVFTINPRQVDQKLRCFDHGFVDLSQYAIATTQFQAEEEVLLNALNVYRITKIISPQDSPDQIGRVYLEYGAIFDLYQKTKDQLSPSEKSVLANYRYCIKEMNQIEDHGDILMKAQQYDKCKQFYEEKIKQEQKPQYFNKLADAQFHCGQTEEARLNAIKSLQIYEQDLKNHKLFDEQKCRRIYHIHETNMKILLQKQDSLNAKKAVNFSIQLIDQRTDWILKAQKLMERGQIHLKQGNIIESEKDLKQSERIILQQKNSFSHARQLIETKYFYKNLCRCCFLKDDYDDKKQSQIQKVDQEEKEMLMMTDKIHELLLKINECFMNVAEIVGNKKLYQQCVKKGKQIFEQMPQIKIQNTFEKAKVKVLQAKVENAFQQADHVQKSYGLMEEAIDMIQKIEPMHEKIGQYSTLLGLFHKKQWINDLILPKQQTIQKSVHLDPVVPYIKDIQIEHEEHEEAPKQSSIQRFNEQKYKQKYTETKQNFQKALIVTSYHKTEDHPFVFQIRNYIGQIEYEYSHFSEGKEQADIVLRSANGPKHSQGAKSALLIAKIHLSQGQITEAFDNIQRAHSILQVALIKEANNPLYDKVLKMSPVYMQIQLFRCRIYNRQMKHDLALSSIKNLRDIGKKKLKDADGVGYLADIYEQMANILVCQGDTMNFEKYYGKAIALRQNQMGKYNILNAICLCTMAKYLIFTTDMDSAQNYLESSFEIFSRFAYDHPNFWIQLSTMAYFSEKTKDNQNQLRELRQSVRLISKRYSKNHINFMKMRVRYAQVLMKNNKHEEALPIYENLEKQMQDDISLSRKEVEEQGVRANQKFALRRHVQTSLRETRLYISNTKEFKVSKIETSAPQRSFTVGKAKQNETSMTNLVGETAGQMDWLKDGNFDVTPFESNRDKTTEQVLIASE